MRKNLQILLAPIKWPCAQQHSRHDVARRLAAAGAAGPHSLLPGVIGALALVDVEIAVLLQHGNVDAGGRVKVINASLRHVVWWIELGIFSYRIERGHYISPCCCRSRNIDAVSDYSCTKTIALVS
jgi:hypothetical protein